MNLEVQGTIILLSETHKGISVNKFYPRRRKSVIPVVLKVSSRSQEGKK